MPAEMLLDERDLYRKGLGKTLTSKQRARFIAAAAEQRYVEFTGGQTKYTAGAPLKLTGHAIGDEFYDFHRTPRGEVTPADMLPQITTVPTLATNELHPFDDMESISPRPTLFITGSEARTPASTAKMPTSGCRAEGAVRRPWGRPCGSLRSWESHSL